MNCARTATKGTNRRGSGDGGLHHFGGNWVAIGGVGQYRLDAAISAVEAILFGQKLTFAGPSCTKNNPKQVTEEKTNIPPADAEAPPRTPPGGRRRGLAGHSLTDIIGNPLC